MQRPSAGIRPPAYGCRRKSVYVNRPGVSRVSSSISQLRFACASLKPNGWSMRCQSSPCAPYLLCRHLLQVLAAQFESHMMISMPLSSFRTTHAHGCQASFFHSPLLLPTYVFVQMEKGPIFIFAHPDWDVLGIDYTRLFGSCRCTP